MKSQSLLLLATFAGALLSGCTTTPNPAEVCTAEWIEPRANAAVERIERRVGNTLDAIRSVAKSWIDGDRPGPIQMFRLSNALDNLEAELTVGRGVRDLRMLAKTCDDPDLIQAEIESLLEREGLPEPLLDFLSVTGILDRIIRTAEGPVANG